MESLFYSSVPQVNDMPLRRLSQLAGIIEVTAGVGHVNPVAVTTTRQR